jgi:pyridoxal phosphate enzyme (YggS family)
MPALNICIQVNVSGEASKSGCAPADLPALAKAISELPRLQLRGLMAIPEPTDDRAAQDAAFAAVRDLRDSLQTSLQSTLSQPLDTLSMGMSHDLESAIAQGATCVRIGTALFGARDYARP